jgi:diadenosine tetraphosphate (Ap4A) HIT family hydrolase
MTDGCYSCAMNERLDRLPPRELIAVDGAWRVAHAIHSALPGWLVVVPMRHVEALEEMTEDEVAPLGPLLRRSSLALQAVTGALKSYVMFFAEAEGFAHLHIHLVPRMASFTEAQIGPRVLEFLGRPEAEWISDADQDELALRLRDAIAANGRVGA